MTYLVVGATGFVGSEVCRLLREAGLPVRALVRASSTPDKVARLERTGAEIVRGDVRDRSSLDRACRDAAVVISTASSTLSRQPGDSIATVDQQGQLDLVDAAEASGVGRFVFVSFPPVDIDFPLQTAKRAVEERLRESGMSYTILQPTFFIEAWLGPMLGFDVAGGNARIYGAGESRTSWISFQDVARFAAAAATAAEAKIGAFKLGGPDALSPLDVVRLAEQATGRPFVVEHVPEQALRAQYGSAVDPMEKSFAALMLYYADGDVIDSGPALHAFDVRALRSVREHLAATASAV
jgi:NADH dehydrogenase